MSAQFRFSALYPVIGVERPAATAAALQLLFGLAPVFETDWYVHLKSSDGALQIGIVRFDHASVPAACRRPLGGTAAFVTVDADDVAAVWEARKADLDVVLPMTDEAWGQRHFICRVPGDILVDVVQLLPQQA